MKKIVAWCLALVLVMMVPLSGLAAGGLSDAMKKTKEEEIEKEASNLEEEKKLAELRELVQNFLEEKDLEYEYDVDYDCYDMTFPVENSFGKVKVSMFIYDDAVSVSAYLPFYLKDETEEKSARLAALLNEEMFYSTLVMSHQYKTIHIRSFQYIDGTMPGSGELEMLLLAPVAYVEKYGEAISAVVVNGADPVETYELVTKQSKSDS